jgi:hypothetical protein
MDDFTLARHYWLERVRATIRYSVGVLGTQRTQLAEVMQTNPAALRKLLRGGVPSDAHMDRIERYLAAGVVEDAYAEQAALSALVERMPLQQREKSRRLAVKMLREGYRERGEAEPEWITYERAGCIVMASSHTIPMDVRRTAVFILINGPSGYSLPEDA